MVGTDRYKVRKNGRERLAKREADRQMIVRGITLENFDNKCSKRCEKSQVSVP